MSEIAPGQRPEDWSAGARGYDESFAIYTAEYAEDAIELLAIGPGDRVLDVAAGTGAFALRAALSGADVLAVDFSPGMVELLAELADDQGLPMRVEEMDGQALGLADGEFDVTCSMFGVIFFPDLDRGLSELARVTRSGGRVGLAVWDLTSFRITDLVGDAFAAVLPGFTRPNPPAWAHLGEREGLSGALSAAGLTDVEVHAVGHAWRFDDPAAFFRRIPDWAPPARPLFEATDPSVIDAAAEAFATTIARRADEDDLTARALIGIGTRP